MMKRNDILRSVIVMILLVAANAVFAQPGGGGGSGGGGSPPPGATGAPIDGGAVMLLAGVAGYIYRTLKPQKSTQ